MAFSSVGRRRAQTPIYLNLYDLAPSNEFLHPVGIGFYHSGVEIMGKEYTFAATAGIFDHSPRSAPPARFREQIRIGTIDGGMADVQDAIRDLSLKFGPNDYNILNNNCNHFSNALCRRLTQTNIPAYVNRMADLGSCCSCILPKEILGGAPVNQQQEDSQQPLNSRAPTSVTMSRTAVFSGNGSRLGGGRGSYEKDTLTDRRDKARLAALARFDQTKQESD